MITSSDVRAAATRIAGHVRTTPLIEADQRAFPSAARVWLKLEQLQHTGSFKVRGAFNRILSAAEQGTLPMAGVVAASGGNAGLAVAYAAARNGLPARVYVPTATPRVKVARLREYGAEVVQDGARYADAYEAAAKHAARTGALFCHAYDQPEICAGQGTLGLELLNQADEEVNTVLVAVGGGGLMAGVAAATEGRVTVVGVEPDTIPTLHAALAAGHPVDVTVSGVAADSLGATRLGDIAYAMAASTRTRSVLVSDADIIAAREHLWERYRLAVEHGGATAFAALFTGAYQPAEGERIGVVLCGANTDPATLIELGSTHAIR
jgi:threonine dehydratase